MQVHKAKAVLFDLDGTLVNSQAGIDSAWRRWAVENSFPESSVVEQARGVPAAVNIRQFVDNDLASHIRRIEELELESADDTLAIAGAQRVLDGLRKSEWAIVTSSTSRLASRRLTASRIPLPDVLVTVDDVKCGKPDPECYLLAARKLGIPIEWCVGFEDTDNGIQSLRSAGIVAIRVGEGGYNLDTINIRRRGEWIEINTVNNQCRELQLNVF